ncbi:hypothetical protein CDAR_374981 [Caerostris darwini]|uniref:Uncharacterized protein n=1 Tax=Caerostris darwini TaxID=1538125 RepID=A0AAV4RP83_9ARAC|nr:hypothetical protein CDAR_374981 [Caerostris darwini]
MDLPLCKRCASKIVEAEEKPTMDLSSSSTLVRGRKGRRRASKIVEAKEKPTMDLSSSSSLVKRTKGKVHLHRYGFRTKRGEELN